MPSSKRSGPRPGDSQHAGTAPGLVVPPADGRSGPTIVVMPGPPRELHEMWPKAVASAEFRDATAGRTDYEQRMLRLFGIPESEIAETLRVADQRVGGGDQTGGASANDDYVMHSDYVVRSMIN